MQLYRYDGFPIDIRGWIEARNTQADAFEVAKARELTAEDLDQFQKDSAHLDTQFPKSTTITFPTTMQEQQSLNAQYGDILYANDDNGNLVAVVMTPSQYFLDEAEVERQKAKYGEKPLRDWVDEIQSRKNIMPNINLPIVESTL